MRHWIKKLLHLVILSNSQGCLHDSDKSIYNEKVREIFIGEGWGICDVLHLNCDVYETLRVIGKFLIKLELFLNFTTFIPH